VGDGVFYSTIVSDVLTNAPWFGTADPAALGKDAADFLFNGAQSNFIGPYFLAWLAGNFGHFAFVAVVLVFLLFFAFSLRTCLLQRSMLYRFTSLGILLYFLIEFICHVLACLAVFRPLSSLPFISGNAAAMLCNAALAGLLFSLLYNGALTDDGVEKKHPGWRGRLVKEVG
jgi:cell division protein FtsW (lipid II flippase)